MPVLKLPREVSKTEPIKEGREEQRATSTITEGEGPTMGADSGDETTKAPPRSSSAGQWAGSKEGWDEVS